MEFPALTSFRSVSTSSLCPCSSTLPSYPCFFRRRWFGFRPNRYWKPFVRIAMSSERDSVPLASGMRGDPLVHLGENSEFIEVIGIGSRRDAVLDFCLSSPFQIPALRFWTIFMKDSQVRLQQWFNGEDPKQANFDASLLLQSCSKAIILVMSAGFGSDQTAAVDILEALRLTKGFFFAVVLKPFSFEGPRRQDEVRILVEKLKEKVELFIEIDADALLNNDMVTLDEAVKSANNAVLLAINALSVLVSGMYRKLIAESYGVVKEFGALEVNKILKCDQKVKIGFGAGYNMQSSILQSIYDCPFLGIDLKDVNSMVICVLASSGSFSDSDVLAFLHTFWQSTEYRREIIIATVHSPNLEPNLLSTTVLALGSMGQPAAENNIFSRLSQYFPFAYNFWTKHCQQLIDAWGNSLPEATPYEVIDSQEFDEKEEKIAPYNVADDYDIHNYVEAFQAKLISKNSSLYGSSESEKDEDGSSGTTSEYSSHYDEEVIEGGSFVREPLKNWNLGSGDQMGKEWTKEREADIGVTSVLDNPSIFHLPAGIKPPEELKEYANDAYNAQQHPPYTEDNVNIPVPNSTVPSWSALTGGGFEEGRKFRSALFNRNGNLRKQGVLSHRAATMLEVERDSPKKWNPILEMQYSGAVYKGRCQGGLPEGKGSLLLGDGSMYDGMWRYGKRSGTGTFYFNNGDVFQGSWRDDAIHGKGWLYFQTGDRWFANFWKGKANGEGRFYSKSGDAFFGHFKDGWRHGQFLCINANGTRRIEIWEQGVLIRSEHLDADYEIV